MATLIEHLESFAGPITHGWAEEPDARRAPFQVVVFSGGPHPGARMISTLGLSHHELVLSDGRTHGRQELMMLFQEDRDVEPLAAILQQVGLERLASHRACLQGGVIGPRDQLLPDSETVALYCAAPVYFPDGFMSYRSPGGHDVMILWLVPITLPETRLCLERGWRAFETLLVEQDPDLTDLRRASLRC